MYFMSKTTAMKLKLILILIVLLCACNKGNDVIEFNTEVIIDVSEKNKYLENLFEHHPDRQVKIYSFKVGFNPYEHSYALYVYRKSGTQPIHLAFGTSAKYSKVAYKWDNDSTLGFRLFNATNNVSAHYTYWTHGTSYSLRRDSINNVPMN